MSAPDVVHVHPPVSGDVARAIAKALTDYGFYREPTPGKADPRRIAQLEQELGIPSLDQ